MPFLCRTLLSEYKYQDGTTWESLLNGNRPYDIHNLIDAIEWAKGYLRIGTNHYDVDYRHFIKWCAKEIRKQLQSGFQY